MKTRGSQNVAWRANRFNVGILGEVSWTRLFPAIRRNCYGSKYKEPLIVAQSGFPLEPAWDVNPVIEPEVYFDHACEWLT